MTHHRQDEITGIHKVPLYGALSVVVLTVFLVGVSALTGKGTVGRTIGEPAIERSISFKTEAAGGFSVLDADTSEKIHSFGLGEGAFIRSSIRSMSLNRTSKRVQQNLPYRLVRTAEGKLSLIDPQTSHFIKLNAFGAVATTSFSQLLPDAAAGSGA